ncbi:MAG: Zn-dependent hydrolase [Gammaproteobacteria bacterium]|nr:Zn-dependent hydrolase [Gammaproteobacteria bacterium]
MSKGFFRASVIGLVAILALTACGQSGDKQDPPLQGTTEPTGDNARPGQDSRKNWLEKRKGIYAPFTLTADLSSLGDRQKRMLVKLIQASEIMDGLYWDQALGAKEPFLSAIVDPDARKFAELNYGPWDRLANEAPFIEGYTAKPPGANLYPADMTAEEFEAAELPGKDSLYTLLRRDPQGELYVVPYSAAYAEQLTAAAALLREAAALAVDSQFSEYLTARAEAFLSNDYYASDMLWMEMKNNAIDVVIGPIETYEDRLFGYKAAFESYVLLKDLSWSRRLSRYVGFLPQLQRGLPVADEYKVETPGTDSDLNAYDVLYYAGRSNAGSKTIAINLPNDERVQLAKGTRRLQLKNAMQAKFDKIMLPIAGELIVEEQRTHVTFAAFFANTMFHEVAHGLGIKNTIDERGTVRIALKELASAMEEGKADVLGVYMITSLHQQGKLDGGALMDYYVTFLAGIFRSVRFGASSAHGKANMVRFNFFHDMGAFSRDPDSGQYRVDFERMQESIAALSALILTLQGDGDYAGASRLLADKGNIGDDLQTDLDRLAAAGIPVDIDFVQGVEFLGLD